MPEQILTPFVDGQAVDLTGLTYRKRILRPDTIDYKGRTITFDEDYFKTLANSYAARKFEQVPFTLADDDNKHTDDPERVRGDVLGIDMARPGEQPGLYMNMQFPNEQAMQALAMNPKLAVSCRIVERDGQPAIKHVCGTTDARVADLGPWEAVSLSADEQGEIIDLTAYEGDDMADGNVLDLSDEEIDQLLDDAAAELDGETDPDKQDDDDTPDDDEDKDEPVTQTADLSTEDRTVIDLARAEASEARNEVAVLKRALAAEKWGHERDAYANDGVPAHILDLAAPLLVLPEEQVIDLSNPETGEAESVNATDIVRGILEEYSGTVNLSKPRGKAIDLTDDEKVDADARARGIDSASDAQAKDLGKSLGLI